MKTGDLIGVSGYGLVSGVINAGTFALPRPLSNRGISHIGIICADYAEPLVYESTTTPRPPCAVTGHVVRGAQAHRLDDFLDFKGNDVVWHIPLRRPLYDHEAYRLQESLDSALGRPYDMLGAFRAGGFLFRTMQGLLRREDVSSLFCSEWCAAVLANTGIFQTRSAGKWSPNALVRHLVRSGICDPQKLLQQ
jgi:hypothetical protein